MILDTAERLFAEQGVMSVSNRQISDAAGQGNNTAVGYHFGTKVDLVTAIVRRHQSDIEHRRERMAVALPSSAGVRDWVACLVRPPAEHLEDWNGGELTYYARFSAQLLANPELRGVLAAETTHTPSLRRTLAALEQSRPDMPECVRTERDNMARQLVTWGYAEREKNQAMGLDVLSWDAHATILVDSITGLWLAPWTETELRSSRE